MARDRLGADRGVGLVRRASRLRLPSGNEKLSTAAGKPLTISPDQLLVATNGVTPVAFGKPAHGNIAYGSYGAMVYTPDAGFTGTDQLRVTVEPRRQALRRGPARR